MRKLLLSISTLFIALSGLAQDNITVCHTASTEKFAMFASNKKFNAEHPNPRVYVHISEEGGQMIHFKTPEGGEGNAYFIQAKKKPRLSGRRHAKPRRRPTIGFLCFRNGGD